MTRNPDTFSDKKTFFEALRTLAPKAIRHLSEKLLPLIHSVGGVYLLSREDIEELNNDAILITLQKLQDGSFQFQDYDPVSYALGVTRMLVANRLRKKNLNTVPMDGVKQEMDGVEVDPEQYYLHKESEKTIGQLLDLLGNNCKQIIRLKYYDNFKDQEVIDRQLSPYSTVDSLKNKRSQCLRKLSELVKHKGLTLRHFLK